MRRRSSAGLWLLLWLMVASGLPAWSGPQAVAQRVQHEWQAARHLHGMGQGAWPRGVFVAPVRPATAQRVGADPGPARRLTRWLDGYAAALAWQAEGMVARLLGLVAWAVWLAPLLGAVVVDGLTQRAIKADTFGYQNPAAWALARHAVVATAGMPAFVLLWPGVLPPAWGAVCVAAVLLPLRLALAHLQPVFTR